jgi:hypothetical protein
LQKTAKSSLFLQKAGYLGKYKKAHYFGNYNKNFIFHIIILYVSYSTPFEHIIALRSPSWINCLAISCKDDRPTDIPVSLSSSMGEVYCELILPVCWSNSDRFSSKSIFDNKRKGEIVEKSVEREKLK